MQATHTFDALCDILYFLTLFLKRIQVYLDPMDPPTTYALGEILISLNFQLKDSYHLPMCPYTCHAEDRAQFHAPIG